MADMPALNPMHLPPDHPQAGRALERLRYRPGLGTVGLASGFFGGAAAFFWYLIRTGEGGWLMVPLLVASLGFVGMGLFAGVMGQLRPQEVVVYERGLALPVGTWWKGNRRMVLLAEVHGLRVQEHSGQAFATLTTADGAVSLNRAMLPDRATFDHLLAFVQGATWRQGTAAHAHEGAAPAPPTLPPVPWVDRMGGRLVLNIGALLAFCGGPLRLSDALKPELGQDPAFAVAFAPVALLLFGTFALAEDEPGWFARSLQHLGALGAAVVAVLGSWAWVGVAQGPARGDDGLVLLGSAVSLPLCGLYLWSWWRQRE
jgi:hypothetical protein